jgi:hypothetical protein
MLSQEWEHVGKGGMDVERNQPIGSSTSRARGVREKIEKERSKEKRIP